MAAVLDITDCPRVELAELLNAGHGAARARLAAGGRPAPVSPMLWTTGRDEIDGPHQPVGSLTPDVELYALQNALVGGAGGQVRTAEAYLHAGGVYPGYVKVWVENDITPEHWAFEPRATSRLERAFAITHFNHVWGHWLTEVYPKLFLIRALAEEGIRAPLLLPRTVPGFIRQGVAATLPDQEVIYYHPSRDVLGVEQLLLPDMMNRSYVFHDAFRTALRDEARRLWRPPERPRERLFISRRRLDNPSDYRELENAEALENEARRSGFEIVHPERLSWPEQVNLFAGASVIVGEFGSGLHNAIVSRAGTRIVAMNWIVDVQSRIANFRGHRVGYIMPSDGEPRRYTIGQTLQPFSVDLGEFRRRLDEALESGDSPPLGGYEDLPVLTGA